MDSIPNGTAQGCYKYLDIEIIELETSVIFLNETLCQGENITIDGQSFSTSGSYTIDAGPNQYGCDSTIFLELQVFPTKRTTYSPVNICFGSSYGFGGKLIKESGQYFDTLSTSNGCDSILDVSVTVVHPDTILRQETICFGSSVNFGGQTINIAGTYFAKTGTNSEGCDEITQLNLSIRPESTNAISATICDGETYEFAGSLLTTTQIKTHVFTNQYGCDSTVTLDLTVLNNKTYPCTLEFSQGTQKMIDSIFDFVSG